jgi:hypothetical protein
VRLLADTLFLADDGTGREVQRVQLLDNAARLMEEYTTDTNLEYTFEGGRLEIAYECADSGSCIAPPHLAGVRTDLGLEFDLALGRVPLVFERLPDTP